MGGPAVDRERRTDGPVGVFVGLATLDVVHYVDAQAGSNEKVTATAQRVTAGGPAANAAVTYAALGGRALLVTALGSDPVADLIRADLRLHGVSVVDAAEGQRIPASVSAVAVTPDGERSVVGLDATGLTITDVPDLGAVLAEARVVLVDGHHPSLAGAAIAAARDHGVPVVLDAGRWKPQMEWLILAVATMICSADFRLPGTDSPDATAAGLAALGVPTVLTTYGGGPVRWWSGGTSGAVAVPQVDAVDTLGAGDVFHGAYCHAMTSDGLSVAGRIELAAQVAALKVSVLGSRAWIDRLPHR